MNTTSSHNDTDETAVGRSYEEACDIVYGEGTLFQMVDGEVDGVEMPLFALAPPNVAALYGLAAANAESEFAVFEDERWLTKDVLGLAGQYGDVLVNQLGVKKGDRVAIALRNVPEWISAFIAITSVGAVAVPLNAWWQSAELAYAISDSGSKVIFVDASRAQRILDAKDAPADLHLLGVRLDDESFSGSKFSDLDRNKVKDVASMIVEGATMPAVDVTADDYVFINYTSGTTGAPKGAVSTHRSLVHSLMAFASRLAVTRLVEAPATMTPAEVEAEDALNRKHVMLCVPLFHVTGLVPIMLGAFLANSKLIMTFRWDPDRALKLIDREKVTHFVGVPTMAWDLIAADTFGETDTSSLRYVGGGGAPMPPELVERIATSFSAEAPGLAYGLTETNAYGPGTSAKMFLDNPTSTGRFTPIADIAALNEAGEVLPAGETGELAMKGPFVFDGYWNRPEDTAAVMVNGWFRTGDIGRVDDRGFVYISDRLKDMVLRGGENIYCTEVEAALYEHPAVYEAAVYGIPHERLGEELAAHVMLIKGKSATVEDLQVFLADRLALFKVPSVITLVGEQLPRNAAGKIVKRELRDLMIAQQEASA